MTGSAVSVPGTVDEVGNEAGSPFEGAVRRVRLQHEPQDNAVGADVKQQCLARLVAAQRRQRAARLLLCDSGQSCVVRRQAAP